MSLKIRMSRAGAKKRPFYRIVVADSRYPRDGRFIDRIGTYNPLLPKGPERLVLDVEKAQEWLKKGATPSDRVARFLDEKGLMKRKARNNPEKAIPKKERGKEAEAAAAPAGGAAPAAAAPVTGDNLAPAEDGAPATNEPAADAVETPAEQQS